MKMKLFFGCAAIASMLSAAPAMAETDSGTLNVTATVAESCTVGDADLEFGAYDGLAQTAVDGATVVAVHCTNDTPYKLFSSTSVVSRKMDDGSSNYLTYKLFTDSGRGTQLGTDATADNISGTGDGDSNDIDIFATIDAGQNAVPGNYAQATADITVDF